MKTNNFFDPKQSSLPFLDKLLKIKLAIFDVDGILTDARVFYAGQELGFNRYFNVRDGYGLKVLKEIDVMPAIITGGDSEGLKQRFKQLGIEHFYFGNEDKRSAYINLIEKTKLKHDQVLYMGDELFDIPILNKVGFSATVKTASYQVREAVDYICETEAGMGAAREVIDMLLYVNNFVPNVLDFD